jgi:hypothetical protein
MKKQAAGAALSPKPQNPRYMKFLIIYKVIIIIAE